MAAWTAGTLSIAGVVSEVLSLNPISLFCFNSLSKL